MNQQTKNIKKLGFTLFEFLLVIVIIGILAVMGLPKIIDLVSATQESVRDSTVGSIQSALNMYASQKASNGEPVSYPDALDLAPVNSDATDLSPMFGNILENGITKYWHKWSDTCYSFTGADTLSAGGAMNNIYKYDPATGTFERTGGC